MSRSTKIGLGVIAVETTLLAWAAMAYLTQLVIPGDLSGKPKAEWVLQPGLWVQPTLHFRVTPGQSFELDLRTYTVQTYRRGDQWQARNMHGQPKVWSQTQIENLRINNVWPEEIE